MDDVIGALEFVNSGMDSRAYYNDKTNRRYDYRKYNIKKDNRELKGKILVIKNGYEVEE